MNNSLIKTVDRTISFSVIIPNKHRLTLLRRAVKSVLKQSYNKFEIIIIDDSSEDEFSSIVNEMGQHEKIKIVRGSGEGAAKARLMGYMKASSPYIAFLDSDDYWGKDKLLYHANAYSLYPEIVACFDLLLLIKDGKQQKVVYPPINYVRGETVLVSMAHVHKELLKDNFIHASAGSFKKYVLGDDFSPKSPNDYLTWLRLSARGSFGVIGCIMTTRTDQPDSLTWNKKILFEESVNIFKEKFLLINTHNILNKYTRMKFLFFSIFILVTFYFAIPPKVKKIILGKSKANKSSFLRIL